MPFLPKTKLFANELEGRIANIETQVLAKLTTALGLAGLADSGGFVKMTTAERAKLASLVAGYKGAYTTLAALQAAHPSATVNDWAILTKGSSTSATMAAWDSDNVPPAWVDTGVAPPTVDWANVLNKPAISTPASPAHATYVGNSAGLNNTQCYVTAIGSLAGASSSSIQSTLVGFLAGEFAQGAYHTCFGGQCGQNSNGTWNVAFGVSAAQNLVGSYNVAMGGMSLVAAKVSSCVAVGYGAGVYLNAASCSFVGQSAGGVSTANSFVGVGHQAGQYADRADNSVAIGVNTGRRAATVGAAVAVTVSDSGLVTFPAAHGIPVGRAALYNLTSGTLTAAAAIPVLTWLVLQAVDATTAQITSHAITLGGSVTISANATAIYTNWIAIGNTVEPTANNEVRLGNAGVTTGYIGSNLIWTAGNKASVAEVRVGSASKAFDVATLTAAAATVTLTYGATVSVDMSTFLNSAKVTLAGSALIASPTNAVPGRSGKLRIIQDATGGRAATFGAAWKFPGGVAPTLSTAANAIDDLYWFVDATGEVSATLAKDVR